MPKPKQARRTDVKDMRSVLRLTYEQGLSVRTISDRLKLSKTTVSTYLLRAREAGLTGWPLPPATTMTQRSNGWYSAVSAARLRIWASRTGL